MQRREVFKDCWLRVIRNLSGIQQSSINICSATKAMQHHNLGNLPSLPTDLIIAGEESSYLRPGHFYRAGFQVGRLLTWAPTKPFTWLTYSVAWARKRGGEASGESWKSSWSRKTWLYSVSYTLPLSFSISLFSLAAEKDYMGGQGNERGQRANKVVLEREVQSQMVAKKLSNQKFRWYFVPRCLRSEAFRVG